MTSEQVDRPDRRRTMWLSVGLLALITISGAFVQRQGGTNAAAAAACIYGGGVLAMALLTARATAYPRWAWFASAGVMVMALGIAATRMPGHAVMKEWTSMAWMLPWVFIIMSLSPSRVSGWCSPRAAWSGPLLVGMSAMYSSILLIAAWLSR
jgi:hypothetical protein